MKTHRHLPVEIKTPQEAKALWAAFHEKYSRLKLADPSKDHKSAKALSSQPILTFSRAVEAVNKSKKQAGSTKKQEKKSFTKDEAAKKVASFVSPRWRELCTTGRPVTVRAGKRHSDMFKFFLHREPIKKSLHREKLAVLEKAIHDRNLSAPIFQDKLLPHLAVTLFSSGRISDQEMFSVLHDVQVKKEFKSHGHYPILNADGSSFSAEALQYLIPRLQNTFNLRPLDRAGLESFRLLVAALPRSQQYFYTSYLGPYQHRPIKNTFLELLINLDSALYTGNASERGYLVHLSYGVMDALGLARFGLERYIRPIPQLGMQNINDTEAAVRQKARPVASYYPNTKPFEIIHGNIASYFEGAAHDFYHALVMSTIPTHLLDVLLRFVDITRQLGFEWSKEIYAWIDCEFNYFLLKNKREEIYKKDDTTLLCDLLNNTLTDNTVKIGGYLVSQGEVTAAGLAIFFDMLERPREWMQLGIDPLRFTAPFAEYLADLQHITSLSGNPLKIKLLKSYCYFMLKQAWDLRCFETVCSIIDQNMAAILQQFNFKKLTKHDLSQYDARKKNMIAARFQDQDVKHPNNLLPVLELEFKKHFQGHPDYDSDLFTSYFADVVVKDGYSQHQALSYAIHRFNNVSNVKARLKVNWAKLWDEKSLPRLEKKVSEDQKKNEEKGHSLRVGPVTLSGIVLQRRR